MKCSTTALVLVIVCSSPAAAGQQTLAVSGVARDQLGLPVAGVDIVLSGPSGPTTVTTPDDGTFRFEPSVPGPYEMRATKAGFREWTRRLQLDPEAPVSMDVDLQSSYAETLIVAASRVAESLISAPASVTVVGSQQIQTSAADNYADLLRSVPGLNITQFGARDININTRNSTGILANSMLVMLDGRAFFQPFYGAVYWDLMTVSTDEISQIEVVRSPASAVWGANALGGVINIRTKSPRQLQGSGGRVGFGERGTKTIGMWWADSTDRLSYKLSGSYFEQDPWDRDNTLPDGSPMPTTAVFENRGTKQPKLDVRVDWDEDPSRIWSLRGGIAGANGFIHSALGPSDFGAGSYASYLELSRTTDNLDFKVYWNRLDAPFRIVLFGLNEDLLTDSFVTDIVRQLKVAGQHSLTFGGSLRLDRFDITIARRDRERFDAGVFVEDKIAVSPRLSLAVGGRVDKFDTTRAVFAPRLGAVLSPTPTHSVRFTYNRAYRAPSLLENFVDVALPTMVPIDPPFFYSFLSLGSIDLEMERQDAIEIGYTGVVSSRATFSAAAYHQRVVNNIWFFPMSFYGPGAPPPGWPLDPNLTPLLPRVFSFVNLGNIRNRGIELGLNLDFARASIQGSYTFQEDPHLSTVDGLLLPINRPARHQGGGGVRYATNTWTFSGDVQYTDRAFWSDVLTDPFWGYTDAYLAVNARASYRLPRSPWELWLSASNLFDEKIKSHVFGDTVRRKITGGMRWRLER